MIYYMFVCIRVRFVQWKGLWTMNNQVQMWISWRVSDEAKIPHSLEIREEILSYCYLPLKNWDASSEYQ